MLTLQFIPYSEIGFLPTDSKIKKLLGIVKTNKIILMEGKLEAFEETELIEKTMSLINKSFKGIEICTIYPNSRNKNLTNLLRKSIMKMVGYKEGLTIIGPATIIEEIKRNPNKMELFISEKRKRRS